MLARRMTGSAVLHLDMKLLQEQEKLLTSLRKELHVEMHQHAVWPSLAFTLHLLLKPDNSYPNSCSSVGSYCEADCVSVYLQEVLQELNYDEEVNNIRYCNQNLQHAFTSELTHENCTRVWQRSNTTDAWLYLYACCSDMAGSLFASCPIIQAQT